MKLKGNTDNAGDLLVAQDLELLTDDDRPIHGVNEATLRMSPGAPVQCEMRVYVQQISLTGVQGEFWMQDPRDGELRRVVRVEFEYGDVWEAQA